MKNIVAVLALFTALTGAAQEKALLWKISGNGLAAPSYIFGTIHLSCDATLDKNTLDAMDKTSQLYLELDMDDPNLQSAMMAGINMNGKTLTELASADDIKMLNTILQDKIGMPVAAINTVKPAMVSTMILPLLMGCPIASVEQELVNLSKTQKEEIYGLETVQEQLAVFDAIPYKVQMDELVKSAKDNFKSDKEELDKMTALYKTGDIEGMLAMMNASDNKISAKFQDQLLNNRNANWIPKIEKIAKAKPTFIAVGAGHLAGDKGVIKLLKKKGYTVEPVRD
ncbi:MAG TPA: TraB/GumN family protein [Flavobacterium sp.]|jgi:hypothetical protein